MPCVSKAVQLAKAMGAGLGASGLLRRTLPPIGRDGIDRDDGIGRPNKPQYGLKRTHDHALCRCGVSDGGSKAVHLC
jgi:hypothetical protein